MFPNLNRYFKEIAKELDLKEHCNLNRPTLRNLKKDIKLKID